MDKNSSWSSGHSLICISEVGRCPALRIVLPTSFFWELWEVLEWLTEKREADVPLKHQLLIKGQDSQKAFVIAWRCQHSYLSISASLDPDFMTAKFQAACWLSKSTTWSRVSTAHGSWLPWGLHSCWTMYMAQTICFYLRHFSLEKLWKITS